MLMWNAMACMISLIKYCNEREYTNAVKFLTNLWQNIDRRVYSVYSRYVYSLNIVSSQMGESMNRVHKMWTNRTNTIGRSIAKITNTVKSQVNAFANKKETALLSCSDSDIVTLFFFTEFDVLHSSIISSIY
eukprot:NODE_16_length_49026_cov_1.035992.p22 type:complete len:132 gc:universal NODE_16_length_49026_cov_1.035992:745-350(-)